MIHDWSYRMSKPPHSKEPMALLMHVPQGFYSMSLVIRVYSSRDMSIYLYI